MKAGWKLIGGLILVLCRWRTVTVVAASGYTDDHRGAYARGHDSAYCCARLSAAAKRTKLSVGQKAAAGVIFLVLFSLD
jgi:hypothetical protein